MDIRVLKIAQNEPEEIEIRCHEVTEQIKEIVTFVKNRRGQLTGIIEGKKYEIPVTDVYYIEAVDHNTFIYAKQNIYTQRRWKVQTM